MTDPVIIGAAFGAGILIGSMVTAFIMRRPSERLPEAYPMEYDEPPPRAVVRLTSRGNTTEISP